MSLILDTHVLLCRHLLGSLPLEPFLSVLQLLDLFFEKFPQEFAEFVKRDLARFILIENSEDNTVTLILVILLLFLVDARQETAHKRLHLFPFQRARVVSVDCVEDTLVDFCKLLLVGQNRVEVIDSFLVIHS